MLTIESVIPVSTCTNGLIDLPGCTSVWNSPSTSPPRTFTAPISVIASEAAAPPVVSRSTTTKVVVRRGSSNSSKVDCTNGAGAAMTGTLGRPSDKTVAARAAVPIVGPVSAEPVGDVEVVLPEPARVRLAQLASEVLGRLPAEEIPPSLRAIARFTPSKRSRVGGPVLAAALDSEPAFRAKVAEVVADTTPHLVEALREGTSTAASDPIDTAVVAYLVRPDGWPQLVADAVARWSGERQDTASAELDRLRGELAELRAQARAEPARVRAEVEAALAAQAAELDAARRTVRSRTGELRAAERERDEARGAIEHVRAESAAALLAAEQELARLRDRVADLERGAESARRGRRAERDLDDARLRLLLDTVVDAAAGLRRALDLPVVTVRPADAIDAGERLDATSAARTVGDTIALDRVLDLPQLHVIVDGYNVTKTGYGELPLVDQRTRLVTSLAALRSRAGLEITVAFDGSTAPPSQPRMPRGLRVLFSAADELADDLIRRLVAAEPPGRPVLVVTSDREVVRDVRRAGAWTVPSAVLLARLG